MKWTIQLNRWSHVVILSIVLALLAHLFFISEWLDGRYMVGIGDGVSQMLPFKQLLYEMYQSGEFFYSERFGIGGGTYSQLGYYYATSILFLLSFLFTFVLESIGLIQTPDVQYWADAILVISVLRMTAILVATTYLLRKLRLNEWASLVGAVVYATSVIYFRHVTYWEFFADAMLWLPLLLIAIERLIQKGKVDAFIVMIAIQLVDNFYFAYINFILAFIYIVARQFVQIREGELVWWKQGIYYIAGGLFGLLLAAVSFIPSAYGFLNNYRPAYTDPIPWYQWKDGLIIGSTTMTMHTVGLFALFLFPLYRNKYFRVTAITLLIMVVLHGSPKVGSLFNGFSAPQFRWEYFIGLLSAILVGIMVQTFERLPKRSIRMAFYLLIVAYIVAFQLYFGWSDSIATYTDIYRSNLSYVWINAVFIGVLLLGFFFWKHPKKAGMTTIVLALFIANTYQLVKLPTIEKKQEVSRAFFSSEAYDHADQRALIRRLEQRQPDRMSRIDFMNPTRNNTPIVQHFNGVSVYSSILNREILEFYLFDLAIDMGRETVSRYMTYGQRANLHSRLAAPYIIRKTDDHQVPFGFQAIDREGDYIAYENQYPLPFVHLTQTVFAEADLAEASPLAREQALVQGVILSKEDKPSPIPEVVVYQDHKQLQPRDATWDGETLTVHRKNGGLTLSLAQAATAEDVYVSFTVERLDQDKGFTIEANEMKTTRKKPTSIYRTGVKDVTLRVKAAPTIDFRLPKGVYTFKDVSWTVEDYAILKEAYAQEHTQMEKVEWNGSHVQIEIDPVKEDTYAVLPIPYERGWQARVEGEKVDIVQANYAFMAVPLRSGQHQITLTYRPPFFIPALVTSLLSLLVFIVYLFKARRSNHSCDS